MALRGIGHFSCKTLLTESRGALRGLFTAADQTVCLTVANMDGHDAPLPNRKKRGKAGCPGFLSGEIFDIVGLDEGTCGRRRLVFRVFGPGVPV